MGSLSTNHWGEIGIPEWDDLAGKYGTPFFLYDSDVIGERIDRIRNAFQRLVKVFFAVKANPNLELLRSIRGVVDGLDISSGGELDQAVLAGFDLGKVSFAGPAKTTAELLTSIQKGVGSISVESIRELREIVKISEQIEVKANIVIRINPRLTVKAFGMKMGGKAVQFGIDEEDIGGVIDIIRTHRDLVNFRGIHVYAGSQCFEVSGIEEGVANTLRLAQEIERSTGLQCRSINLGGGFGVSYSEEHRELDVESLGRALVPSLRHFLDSSGMDREIIFELGRYLAADAGIYVTRVISSKQSRGKTFFVVDGGLHHHLAAAGMFGVGIRSNYILKNLTRPDAPVTRCNVAGPLCNPTDLLGIDVALPEPELGDLIGVMKSGSYAFSASPLLFLGRPTPAELIRHQGRIILGRRPRTIVDFN